jgi:acyl carrier protein
MTPELDFRELQDLAAEILRIKPERVQKTISFARDLGADSLDLLELIAAIEDKYKVKLSEQTLNGMPNVGALWVYLEANSPLAVGSSLPS